MLAGSRNKKRKRLAMIGTKPGGAVRRHVSIYTLRK
jgi:hypothetical protein